MTTDLPRVLLLRSRQLFPAWSPRMRRKWVKAKLCLGTPKVLIGCHAPRNPRHERFERVMRCVYG